MLKTVSIQGLEDLSLDDCTRVIRTFSDEVDEKDFPAVESDNVGSYLTNLNITSGSNLPLFPTASVPTLQTLI